MFKIYMYVRKKVSYLLKIQRSIICGILLFGWIYIKRFVMIIYSLSCFEYISKNSSFFLSLFCIRFM